MTVGATDDQGTDDLADDAPASWSSRGTTQDGVAKPDVYAPGARIVSNLAPNSAYADLCASCLRENGEYIRTGGTSMAAPMVAGAAAIGFQLDPTPDPEPDQGPAARLRSRAHGHLDRLAEPRWSRPSASTSDGGRLANQGLTPNEYINPATGSIDYSRSSWSRSSWSTASELLRSSWSRSSWSMAPVEEPAAGYDDTVVPSRSSWSRSSWSRSSWSTSWTK